MIYAAVCFKGSDDPDGIGFDMNYDNVRSWRIRGNVLILTRSRHEHIIIPIDSFTSVEIRKEEE